MIEITEYYKYERFQKRDIIISTLTLLLMVYLIHVIDICICLPTWYF